MTKQDYKNQILSLSACSIPVMLAVAGWSAATHAADSHGIQSYSDGAFVRQSTDTEAMAHQGKTVQSDANWICMSPDNQHFWVSKGQDTAISTYRFTDSSGNYELLEEINDLDALTVESGFSATAGDWIDLELSDDGQFLYQLFGESGKMGVYEVDGGSLTLVEALSA